MPLVVSQTLGEDTLVQMFLLVREGEVGESAQSGAK